jgi:hypothetical protein
MIYKLGLCIILTITMGSASELDPQLGFKKADFLNNRQDEVKFDILSTCLMDKGSKVVEALPSHILSLEDDEFTRLNIKNYNIKSGIVQITTITLQPGTFQTYLLPMPWYIKEVKSTSPYTVEANGEKISCVAEYGDDNRSLEEIFGKEVIREKMYYARLNDQNSPNYRICRDLFYTDMSSVFKKRSVLNQNSLLTYSQRVYAKIKKIPHISHRSWLTNSFNAFEIPREKLENYVESLRLLNSNEDWEHYFWCLDPDKIPLTIDFLLRANVGIVIKKASDLYSSMSALHIFLALLNDNRYTNANDVLRMEILYQYGGLYADIGFLFRNNLTPIIDSYDYGLYVDPACGHLDHSIAFMPRKSYLAHAYRTKISQLYIAKQFEHDMFDKPNQLFWTGSCFLMAVIDSCLSDRTKIFFFIKNGSLVGMPNMNSWRGEGLFGNKPYHLTNIDLFNISPLSITYGQGVDRGIVEQSQDIKKNRFIENVEMAVLSCDKYSSLWEPFFFYLFDYFPELNCELRDLKITLVSQMKRFTSTRVSSFNIPREKSWSDTLIQYLNQCSKKYVIFLLEDYFLRNKVEYEKLINIFDYMEKQSVDYMLLASDNIYTKDASLIDVELEISSANPKTVWVNALQACIWNKDTLLRYLQEGLNPWEFETEGRKWRNIDPSLKYYCVSPNNPIFSYFNISSAGKLIPAMKLLIRKQFPEFTSDMLFHESSPQGWHLCIPPFDIGPQKPIEYY